MVEKNICQNPKCCNTDTKDRWNKKLERYQSRKAYFNTDKSRGGYHYLCKILIYFCTTSCANIWLNDNLENIIERGHTPKKITEKIIRA
tara:strand:+ start:2430 stop:2696 length:267 start_codon:yes stop_codon:yes gene_type:complete